ncbi:reprolysin-like metallopeptidase [Chryseobacterium sp. ISL-6]|uniref:reprolysin-like metallopeptidase n=1 Tax=Chryseobacterium sp. ISL-6 TaxID=2819143 RepID=UPI001BED1C0B|nr:zinc-dependent metalloprotease family protein [Chryseobacterium sp. ISL-6]MBT2623145.1 T9SS type A sorting domain-containing protein [Chryseobacterium sp. ISL-6]
MKKKILLICVLAAGFTGAYAQRWEPASKVSPTRKEVDVKYAYRVDLASLRNLLKDAVETGNGAKPVVISLPTVDGKIEKFAVYSNPVMEKSMADRYQLGSYVGIGIDDPSKYLRFSTSPTEMQSMIIKDGQYQFIEPVTADKQTYGVFYKTKRTGGEHGFSCSTDEKNFGAIKALEKNGKKNLSSVGITSRPSSTKYRTYRLALSVTGEYTAFFNGVPGAVAQINTTMTRVNGVFEKDFGVKLIVQDLPGIIYADAVMDPYSIADDMDNWNLELQNTLTANVGNAAYDIGHLFGASGGGGNAGCVGCICVDPTAADPEGKGSGYTSPSNAVPSGDSFDIDYVAHEIGHQIGGNHTFSKSTENSGVNVEPGGGTTIMGYAGITQDNVQMNSDAYFHYASIDQILTNLEGKPACGIAQDIIINNAPVIAPLIAYSIPKGTAYYLEANAIDAQNDPLNYTWEQYDSVDSFASISGDSGWGYNTQGALSRSWPGTASGRRYFPSMPTVMSGSLTGKAGWETVSYIPRTLHYAVTVRDQNNLRPMLSSSETTVTVGNDGPFKFNGLTASSVLYNNATNTIQWEVANTNAAPYNVTNVKIDYTTNNGTTWTDLVASAPNTGSYSAQMPSSLTGTVKFRISAVGNIFYAVSPQVTIGTAPTSTTNAPTGVATIDTEVFKTTARVDWNSVPGATYSVNYRKAGTTNWSNATSPVNSVVLNNLEDETNYEVQVAAVVNSVPGTFSSNYAFKTKGLKTGVDYCLMTTGGNSTLSIAYSALLSLSLSNLVHSEGQTVSSISNTYRDYSEDPTKLINLIKGTQYTLSYSDYANRAGGQYNDWFQVWIDYNRNGVFEASEKVGAKNAIPGANRRHTGTVVFTVPATAYSGDKTLRMRVASTFFNGVDDACGSPSVPTGPNEFISAGSFRDFPVKITDALAVNEVKGTNSEIEIYPNPADTFVEVKNLKGKADYKIYSAEGRLVQSGKLDGQRINVASLIKGMYIISITSENKTYNTKLIKK